MDNQSDTKPFSRVSAISCLYNSFTNSDYKFVGYKLTINNYTTNIID